MSYYSEEPEKKIFFISDLPMFRAPSAAEVRCVLAARAEGLEDRNLEVVALADQNLVELGERYVLSLGLSDRPADDPVRHLASFDPTVGIA